MSAKLHLSQENSSPGFSRGLNATRSLVSSDLKKVLSKRSSSLLFRVFLSFFIGIGIVASIAAGQAFSLLEYKLPISDGLSDSALIVEATNSNFTGNLFEIDATREATVDFYLIKVGVRCVGLYEFV